MESAGSGKRKQPYFSARERSLLIKLVSEHRPIVENKESRAESIFQRKQTWEKIANIFNAQGFGAKRNSKQLKKYYENQKTRAKKILAIAQKTPSDADAPDTTDPETRVVIDIIKDSVLQSSAHYREFKPDSSDDIMDEGIDPLELTEVVFNDDKSFDSTSYDYTSGDLMHKLDETGDFNDKLQDVRRIRTRNTGISSKSDESYHSCDVPSSNMYLESPSGKLKRERLDSGETNAVKRQCKLINMNSVDRKLETFDQQQEYHSQRCELLSMSVESTKTENIQKDELFQLQKHYWNVKAEAALLEKKYWMLKCEMNS